MALDFALLGPDGSPKTVVSLNMDSHLEFMRIVEYLGLRLSLRFSNYYSDAIVLNDELAELSREIDHLKAAQCSPFLDKFAAELEGLVDIAIESHDDLHVISD